METIGELAVSTQLIAKQPSPAMTHLPDPSSAEAGTGSGSTVTAHGHNSLPESEEESPKICCIVRSVFWLDWSGPFFGACTKLMLWGLQLNTPLLSPF